MELKKRELITRDWLAIERTHLANERTFLAYFRTSVVMLGSGIGIIRIDFFDPVNDLGYVLVGMAALMLPFGVWRMRHVRKKIRKFYIDEEKP